MISLSFLYKFFSGKKSPGPDDLTVEFQQTFEAALAISQLFLNNRNGEGGNPSKLYEEAYITLIPKPNGNKKRERELTY